MPRRRRRRGGSNATDALLVAGGAYAVAFGLLQVERLAAVCAVLALGVFAYVRWWTAVLHDRVRAFRRRHRIVIEAAPSLLLAAVIGAGALWYIVAPALDLVVVGGAVVLVGRVLWRRQQRRAGARRGPGRKRPRSR